MGLSKKVRIRTDFRDATYMPRLSVEMTSEQINEAVQKAIFRLNAGQKIADGETQGVNSSRLRLGTTNSMNIVHEGMVAIGSQGDYPVANMLLLILPPEIFKPVDSGEIALAETLSQLDKKDAQIIESYKIYPVGTRFCFVHCQWVDTPWKHNLPLVEDWYRSIRRTFVALLERALCEIAHAA